MLIDFLVSDRNFYMNESNRGVFAKNMCVFHNRTDQEGNNSCVLETESRFRVRGP